MVKIRVIEARPIEHQAKSLGDSAGEWVVHVARLTSVRVERHLVSRRGAGTGSPRGADLAPGFVADFEHLVPVRVRGEGGGAEVVGEHVFHHHRLWDLVFAHGDAGRACEVVLGDLTAVLDLIVRADEEDRFCAHDGFYPFSVRVEGKGGKHCIVLLHLHQIE